MPSEEVGRFITLTAGITPPEGLVAAVHQETEGNPFFVAEVVRLLVAEGRLERADATRSWSVSLPESVREVVGKRLNRLLPEVNQVLEVASVVGREFRLATLERVTGRPADEMLDALQEAVQARVIEAWEGVGRYRFSHALVQETLYAEVSAARKARLHGQIGDAIERMHAANLTPYLGELAQHYFEAAAAGKSDKAIEYGVKAAERAAEQLAWEAAVTNYQQAAQAIELHEPVDEVRKLEILLALAVAQCNSGAGERAVGSLEQAITLGRTLGAIEPLARTILDPAFRTLHLLSTHRSLIVDELLAQLGTGDSILRAKLLALTMTLEPYPTPDSLERNLSAYRDAMAMAQRLGDPGTLAYIRSCRAYWLWDPDTIAEDLDNATEVVRLAIVIDDLNLEADGRWSRVALLMAQGDVAEAGREIDAIARLAEKLRTSRRQWFALLLRAMLALVHGDFAACERLAEQALVIGQRTEVEGGDTARTNYGRNLYLMRREQGGLGEVEALIVEMSEEHPYAAVRQNWSCLRAALYSELDRESDARAVLERLAGADFVDFTRQEMMLPSLAFLSEVCAYLGEASRAALLYNLQEPYSSHVVYTGTGTSCYGSVSYYLGLLATTLARWDDAARHFEDALAMHQRMGARPFAARTRYAWAGMLATRDEPGDRERALGLLGQALAASEQMGMARLAEQALALKVRLQGILKA